jgi:hypothetical protein
VSANEANENNINLIQCGDDGWSPWSVVCKHLVSGEASRWCLVPVKDSREVEGDWLCPDCLDHVIECGRLGVEVGVGLLKAVCTHCVRRLQERPGVTIDRG